MPDNAPQNQDKFVLRMPDGMRDRIKHAAEANGRSMNAEILSVLHEHYPEPLPGKDLEDRLKALAERIAEEPDAEERRAQLARFRAELDRTMGLQIGSVMRSLRDEQGDRN